MKSLLVDMLLTDGFGDIKCFPCFVRSVPLSHHVTIGSLPYHTQTKQCIMYYIDVYLNIPLLGLCLVFPIQIHLLVTVVEHMNC